mmetsp:Transcript_10919/g.34796  ORF Transcript_10919/g.34796 Transcript_10919/m.34796 type:complete len:215 (-) Transcript_10919:136-780(-)
MGQDLNVLREQQLAKRGQDNAHIERWARLAVAQVAQGPRRDPQQRRARLASQQRQQLAQRASANDGIARGRPVTRNRTQHPHRLLDHLFVGRLQQRHQRADRTIPDQHTGVVRGARRDVGQRPQRLHLQLGQRILLQEVEQLWHHIPAQQLLHQRSTVHGKELPKMPRSLQLQVAVWAKQALLHLGERFPPRGPHIAAHGRQSGRRRGTCGSGL